MILNRLGNKSKLANDILRHFPEHKIYIDPFFGAGGMFFNKPKAKYNIVNDLDSDVFNLFQVVMSQKAELVEMFRLMPIHSDLLEYWKVNKEVEPIRKALRFLFLSNFTYLGKQDTLRFNARLNEKNVFYKYIDKTFERLQDVRFANFHFKKFFNSLSFTDIDFGKPSGERGNAFIYCDPPYLDQEHTYEAGFTESDSLDLFNCLHNTKCKWAMSEFEHPFILQQAKERGLKVEFIGERRNIKNRRTEILIMNYASSKGKQFNFFDICK